MLCYLVVSKYMKKEINAMLLFAPNSVYRQWSKQQLPLHFAAPYETYVWGDYATKKDVKNVEAFTKEKFEGVKVLLVNVEAMSHDSYVNLFRNFVKENKTVVVVDESTRIKTHTAKRTQNIVLGLNDCRFIGKRLIDVLMTSKARYILSGTAVSGAPTEAYSQFNFLKMNYFGKPFTAFKQRYSIEQKCLIPNGKMYFKRLSPQDIADIRKHVSKGCDKGVLAQAMNISMLDVEYIMEHPEMRTSWKNLSELRALIAPCSFIIKIEDCRSDMPDKQFITLDVDMTPEQKAAYVSLKNNLYLELGGSEMTVTNKLVLTGRLQQVTGGFVPLKIKDSTDTDTTMTPVGKTNPKYTVMKEDIEDTGEYPVVIFCRYTAEAKFIRDSLTKDLEDKKVELIIGEVPMKERERILSDFDEYKVDVIVATPGCLATGRNLEKSHIIYFFSCSYSIDEFEQACGRIRRITQKNVCVYKQLACRGTVDVAVMDALANKKELLEFFRTDIKEII